MIEKTRELSVPESLAEIGPVMVRRWGLRICQARLVVFPESAYSSALACHLLLLWGTTELRLPDAVEGFRLQLWGLRGHWRTARALSHAPFGHRLVIAAVILSARQFYPHTCRGESPLFRPHVAAPSSVEPWLWDSCASNEAIGLIHEKKGTENRSAGMRLMTWKCQRSNPILGTVGRRV